MCKGFKNKHGLQLHFKHFIFYFDHCRFDCDSIWVSVAV